jgi:MoxR-like ATPase
MAKAKRLLVGETYPVKLSDTYPQYAGKTARIIDNKPIANGLPNQRKILVEIDGNAVYLLPRLLDDGTLVIQTNSSHTPVPAATVPTPERTAVERKPITDPMDPRLDPYRPHASIVKQYVPRTLPGGKSDIDLLLHFWRNRDSQGYSQNVMLVGDTQSGKTMLVQVLAVKIAQELGLPKPLPVFTLSGSSGVTDFDMLGQPTAHTDEFGVERLVWLPGLVDLAARVPCLFYLDEVNMMPERVTSTLHPVCDDRRTFVNRAKAIEADGEFLPEQVKVNTGCWIIGTYNLGYRGAGALNEAFNNRFQHLPWDYDNDVEKKIIKSPTVLLLARALREARNLRTITTPVGTKALERLWDNVVHLGVETALWAFVGMFQIQERAKVEAIITDRSISALLQSEVDANVVTPETEAGNTPEA